MWRSDPQIPDASTRTTASSGWSGSGSGRSSRATSPGPWKVTACTDSNPTSEQRCGAVALLTPLLPQAVDRREDAVEADRRAPGERAARVAHAELEPRVRVLLGADALAHREAGLVNELADDPAEHH